MGGWSGPTDQPDSILPAEQCLPQPLELNRNCWRRGRTRLGDGYGFTRQARNITIWSRTEYLRGFWSRRCHKCQVWWLHRMTQLLRYMYQCSLQLLWFQPKDNSVDTQLEIGDLRFIMADLFTSKHSSHRKGGGVMERHIYICSALVQMSMNSFYSVYKNLVHVDIRQSDKLPNPWLSRGMCTTKYNHQIRYVARRIFGGLLHSFTIASVCMLQVICVTICHKLCPGPSNELTCSLAKRCAHVWCCIPTFICFATWIRLRHIVYIGSLNCQPVFRSCLIILCESPALWTCMCYQENI